MKRIQLSNGSIIDIPEQSEDVVRGKSSENILWVKGDDAMEEVNEFVDNLERLWNEGQLTECAYQISNLYGSLEYSWISDVMIEFKKRINK